ncbi:putative bifunctional diguanylate cyclase/phosphodiesterase [Kineococcus terrestris]|uniref:putative bifunctional diguanylate cyclase/phosphodiesterase n=1 Tax=Kineococcus terrestris TaxID=2044856 RepID=UPI0034DB70B3
MDVSAVTPDGLEQAAALLEHVLDHLGEATTEREVLVRAAGLLADLADADVAAVCEGGHVHAGVGLGAGGAGGAAGDPQRGLARVVRDRGGSFAVPGLGRVRAEVVAVPDLALHLVVGRAEGSPGGRARDLTVAAMVARAASLVVLGRHGRERERWQQQQDERGAAELHRLQQALRQREQVLTTSVRFQRAVSSRRPLPELLVQLARSSSQLLDGRAVTLVLADPRAGMQLRVVAAVGSPALAEGAALAAAGGLGGFGLSVGGHGAPAAAAVHVNGRGVGALVAAADDPLDAVAATVLRAFAEHASTALSHADTVRAAEQAANDPLTGLPTRAALLRRLEVALAARATDGLGAAVLFLDLDGFQAVKDSLGHAAGDAVLQRAAARLRRCLRGDDVAARLGAAEFAVVVRDEDPLRAALRVAQRARGSLLEPWELDGRAVRVGCSVGVAVADGEVGAAELLRRADSAVLSARDGADPAAGGEGDAGPDADAAGGVAVWSARLADADALRRELESDLAGAVERGEFELAYQPVVRLADGAVVGAEALLRWRHPARGLLDAATFLAGAERSPAADRLWRWVLHRACEDAARWCRRAPGFRVSVNLSAAHALSRSAAEDVRAAVVAAGLDPAALVLELPAALVPVLAGGAGGAAEGAAAGDDDLLRARLHRLRQTGACLVVDGVGAAVSAGRPGAVLGGAVLGGGVLGEGALAPLRTLPLDGVKLDRSLVAALAGERAQEVAPAVGALVRLASALGLRVGAAGVERADQAGALRELGCSQAQGHLLGVPAPAAELALVSAAEAAGSVAAALEAGFARAGDDAAGAGDDAAGAGDDAAGAGDDAAGAGDDAAGDEGDAARPFDEGEVAEDEGGVAAAPPGPPPGAPPAPAPVRAVRPAELRRLLGAQR